MDVFDDPDEGTISTMNRLATGANTKELMSRMGHVSPEAALMSVGLGALHFHDLRHVGNTLAAGTGASTKELMSRMGRASPQVALRYQHATADRDAAIAAALNDLVTQARPPAST